MKITVRDVVENTSCKLLIGNLDEEVKECFIDSKKVKEEGCFIGIKGNKTDGSLYYKEAFNNKANICILNKILDLDLNGYDDKTVLIANDTKQVLKELAMYKRSLFKGTVIGITGSVGKTSTKELIYNVLEKKYKVLKTKGNENSQIGLPLTITRLKDEDVMVLEMGMNDFNQIHNLSLIAKPDIAIITNIYDSHIGILGSRENILKAKLEILDGMDNKTVIVNNDNDLLNNWAKTCNEENIITYGINNESDYMATDIKEREIISFNVKNIDNMSASSTAFIYNKLAAIIVGKILNVSDNDIKKGINEDIKIKHRLEEIKLKGDITIIDDCYNASFESVKNALSYINKKDGRKILILGDILELGKKSKQIHRKIGTLISNCAYLITIGKWSKYISKEARKNGLKKKYVKHFKNVSIAKKYILSIIKPSDNVLIKASNAINLSELVNYLKESEIDN